MSKPEEIIFIIFVGFSLQISLAQANEIEKNISVIPAGEFLMGTDEGTEIERPIHNVYLDEFRINRFEVSNIKFEKFHYIRHKISQYRNCTLKILKVCEGVDYDLMKRMKNYRQLYLYYLN